MLNSKLFLKKNKQNISRTIYSYKIILLNYEKGKDIQSKSK